jgi:hypothetical protein
MSRDDFANLVDRVNPWLEWADRWTAPRLSFLGEARSTAADRRLLPVLSIVSGAAGASRNMLRASRSA